MKKQTTSTFKSIAYEILKEARKPLHLNEITKIAIRKGLKTNSKNPEATMSTTLISGKDFFKKVKPNTFELYQNTNNKWNEKAQNKKMRKPITEEDVKRAVINWLSHNGWGRFKNDKLHRHGVDIKARKNNYPIYYLIEAKKDGNAESSFISSLGQIITRMNVKKVKYKYGLALPENTAKIAIRRIPWQVSQKLLLNILSVNEYEKVVEHTWKDLQRLQNK